MGGADGWRSRWFRPTIARSVLEQKELGKDDFARFRMVGRASRIGCRCCGTSA